MKKSYFTLFLFCLPLYLLSQHTRDLLQHVAVEVGIDQVLLENFDDLGFPTYNDRSFWEQIPEALRKQYISKAEEYLNYDWPVVKATDFLEIIRSGDRRQSVYAAPRAALIASVMGELIEGNGRFMDQIIDGVWYYSEQTWWGWSAHLPPPKGLPDIKRPSIDLGVGEIANILSWTWYCLRMYLTKFTP